MKTSPLVLALLYTASLPAQTFEVASVKPSAPPGRGGSMVGVQGGPGTSDPTRVRVLNMNLKNLVSYANDANYLLVAGPSWIDQDRFDIVATLSAGASKDDMRAMLRNLLTERFKLEVRREQRTIPLYSLVVAKNAAKLTPPAPDVTAESSAGPEGPPKIQKDKDGYPTFVPGTTSMAIVGAGGSPRAGLQAHNQPVEWLIKMLSGQMGAQVNNDTGLADKYDYALYWVPEAPGSIPAENQDLGGPSLTQALQDQLGLKLVAKKGPVEFIVIDKAERKPTEN